jgi:hypothetical protein
MTSAGVIALSPFQLTILPQSLLREYAIIRRLSRLYDVKVKIIRHFHYYERLICGKAKNYGGMLMNTPPQVWGKIFALEVETKPDRRAHARIILVVYDAVIA